MAVVDHGDGHIAIFLPSVTVHLLLDDDGCTLIDTGLIGAPAAVAAAMRARGLPASALHTILLTHGHLDHARGAAPLQAWSGARLLVHPAERPHLDGRYPYRGINRLCDWLEIAGRVALGYRRPRIDGELADGQRLACGLEVLHLPGHSDGHCGFYCPRRDLLFAADLFAFSLGRPHLPPAFLNSCPQRFPESLARVDALAPARMAPAHARPGLGREDCARRYRQWRAI